MTAHLQTVMPPRLAGAIRSAPPCAIVIFGASGDLTRRKLVPALFRLFSAGFLTERFAALGVARSEWTREAFREQMADAVRAGDGTHAGGWEEFGAGLDYVAGDFRDAATYERMAARLRALDAERGLEGNRLFYLATPPSEFEPILSHLDRAGLIASPRGKPWTRVIIEKPFGHDLESAHRLNDVVSEALDESQVFRIDHYLGKETVQNLLVFRFANTIFEPIWNRRYVDYVEISALETLGVERRGAFYDRTGVIRDIVQNHLLQILCLTAMEPPTTGDADDIRTEKLKVLRALRKPWADTIERDVVLGQYRGYREEAGVRPDSTTPTFVAIRAFVDNWRWQGVPFYLRAGKKLARRVTEIAVHMRPIPLCLFGREEVCERIDPNVITLRIQPDEGIEICFASKIPGYDLAVGSVIMDMKYLEAFGGEPPEAYERLLLDAMRGDATLFARRDAVEASWEWVTPLLEHVEAHPPRDFPNYEPGAECPDCARDLMRRDRHAWRER